MFILNLPMFLNSKEPFERQRPRSMELLDTRNLSCCSCESRTTRAPDRTAPSPQAQRVEFVKMSELFDAAKAVVGAASRGRLALRQWLDLVKVSELFDTPNESE